MEKFEKKLIALAQNLLRESGEARAHQPLSLDSSLQHHLGLDSLGRAELFSRIEKQLKVHLPDQLLLEAETLGDILRALETATTTAPSEKLTPSSLGAHQRYEKHRPQKLASVSKAETLLEVLLEHAEKTPDKPYIYLQNENGSEELMTYGQLLSQARALAFALQERGLKPGETVALMLPTQLGFFYAFFGILLASGIPVPIYPPLRPQQLESYTKQAAKILHNAEIRFLITFQQAEGLSRLLQSFVPSLQEVLTLDILLRTPNQLLLPPALKGKDLALIQYTSGSTSLPKGVALTHQNILANVRSFGQAIEVSPQDIVMSWLPLYHDFGLIGMVFGSLYFGLPLILMSPLTFLSRPEKWLWALHFHRATISAAPNFAYELCARKIDEAALEGLDLSAWRIAANGAETIYPKTYERFLEKFKPYGFHAEAFLPVYGLAESTVGLTISSLHRPPRIDVIDRVTLEEEKRALPLSSPSSSQEKLELISCGKALPQHAIRIVDDLDREMVERFVGHLQFQGPSSMQGYYNNPTATQAIYHQGWWDSGDLAYRVDGEVFITGRQKDLIIKAGRNLYPSVLEEQMSDIPGLRRGCVIAFSEGDPEKGTEKIILVAETLEKNTKKREALRQRMTETLISTLDLAPDQIIFVPPRTVPKTSSGKLQRSACKALYLQGKLKAAPAWIQFLKIGLHSLFIKAVQGLKNLLKFFYTLYLLLILGLSILPFWLSMRLLPARFAALLCKRAAQLLRILSGCRLHLEGKQYLTAAKPLIYVANHASYVDALLLAGILPPETRFVGKKELFSLVLLRDVLQKLQHIPVDRLDFTQGLAQTTRLAKVLQNGDSILLFPEGTFSYAAGLRPFKLGAFKIAAETKTPLCPIAIQGTRQILRGNKRLLCPGKLKVSIGEPLYPQGDEWQDIMQLKNQVRDFINAHCGELSLDFSEPKQGRA